MTPKEKAKELINKYKDTRLDNKIHGARLSALFCVDEILKSHPMTPKVGGNLHFLKPNNKYWGEVKKEINLL